MIVRRIAFAEDPCIFFIAQFRIMKPVRGVKMLLPEYGYPFAQMFLNQSTRGLDLFFDFYSFKSTASEVC
jgi:hypothetical protein